MFVHVNLIAVAKDIPRRIIRTVDVNGLGHQIIDRRIAERELVIAGFGIQPHAVASHAPAHEKPPFGNQPIADGTRHGRHVAVAVRIFGRQVFRHKDHLFPIHRDAVVEYLIHRLPCEIFGRSKRWLRVRQRILQVLRIPVRRQRRIVRFVVRAQLAFVDRNDVDLHSLQKVCIVEEHLRVIPERNAVQVRTRTCFSRFCVDAVAVYKPCRQAFDVKHRISVFIDGSHRLIGKQFVEVDKTVLHRIVFKVAVVHRQHLRIASPARKHSGKRSEVAFAHRLESDIDFVFLPLCCVICLIQLGKICRRIFIDNGGELYALKPCRHIAAAAADQAQGKYARKQYHEQFFCDPHL